MIDRAAQAFRGWLRAAPASATVRGPRQCSSSVTTGQPIHRAVIGDADQQSARRLFTKAGMVFSDAVAGDLWTSPISAWALNVEMRCT